MKIRNRMDPAEKPSQMAGRFRRGRLFNDFACSLLFLTLVVSPLSASTIPTIRVIVVTDAAEAKSILAEITKGIPFAVLAKERSVDGSRDNYGEIAKAEFEKLARPLKDAAFQLREGGVSGVITLGDKRYALVHVVDMTFYRNGARAFRSGDFRTAETDLLDHVKFNPDAVKARIMLGRIYESRKEYDKAEANYRDALRFNPVYEEAYKRLGALYLRRGEFRQAKNVYDEGLLNVPGSRALKEGSEKTGKQLSRVDKKPTPAKTAKRKQPEAPAPESKMQNDRPARTGLSKNVEDKRLHVRIIVARTESDAKDILSEMSKGRSMALLAKKRSIDENTREAYGYLGEVAVSTLNTALQRPLLLLKEGQTSGVIRMGQDRYAIAQVTDISLYREGEKALIGGDSVTAEQKLLAYVESNPDAVKARALLGKIYEDRNEFSKAIEMYRKAISFSPKTVLVYERLARVYLLLGEYEKAKDIYTEGLRQVPSSPEMEEGIEMADMLLIGDGSRMP